MTPLTKTSSLHLPVSIATDPDYEAGTGPIELNNSEQIRPILELLANNPTDSVIITASPSGPGGPLWYSFSPAGMAAGQTVAAADITAVPTPAPGVPVSGDVRGISARWTSRPEGVIFIYYRIAGTTRDDAQFNIVFNPGEPDIDRVFLLAMRFLRKYRERKITFSNAYLDPSQHNRSLVLSVHDGARTITLSLDSGKLTPPDAIL